MFFFPQDWECHPSELSGLLIGRDRFRASDRTLRQCWSAADRDITDTLRTAAGEECDSCHHNISDISQHPMLGSTDVSSSTSMRMTTPSSSMDVLRAWCLTTGQWTSQNICCDLMFWIHYPQVGGVCLASPGHAVWRQLWDLPHSEGGLQMSWTRLLCGSWKLSLVLCVSGSSWRWDVHSLRVQVSSDPGPTRNWSSSDNMEPDKVQFVIINHKRCSSNNPRAKLKYFSTVKIFV